MSLETVITIRTTFFVFLALLALSSIAAFSQQDQQKKPFTADRHIAGGMDCAGCHGDGEIKPLQGDKCLSCHESYDALANRTTDMNPNPHDNHQTMTGIDCMQCHKGHKPDVVLCERCHSDIKFARNASTPAK
jgi:fumarate reductase flavoprotein subunit